MNALNSNVNDCCFEVLRNCELLRCSVGMNVFEGGNSEFS